MSVFVAVFFLLLLCRRTLRTEYAPLRLPRRAGGELANSCSSAPPPCRLTRVPPRPVPFLRKREVVGLRVVRDSENADTSIAPLARSCAPGRARIRPVSVMSKHDPVSRCSGVLVVILMSERMIDGDMVRSRRCAARRGRCRCWW